MSGLSVAMYFWISSLWGCQLLGFQLKILTTCLPSASHLFLSLPAAPETSHRREEKESPATDKLAVPGSRPELLDFNERRVEACE